MVNVRRPELAELGTVIRIYYEKIELLNSDISSIFPTASLSAIAKLKKNAREQMEKDSIPVFNDHAVNTESAFAAWGLDIENLKRRYTMLKKFKEI